MQLHKESTMFICRYFFTVVLISCLTSCLKITGAPQDPFDIAHGGEPISVGDLNFFRSKAVDDEKAVSTALTDLNESRDTGEILEATPDGESPVTSQHLNLEFEKWKIERGNSSDEYRQFREYMEYKEWLEYKKKKIK